MKANISRHNRKADWHIRCANDLWKVYDKDQKFRCSFRTRIEAEQYIDQHCVRRPAHRADDAPARLPVAVAQISFLEA